MTTSDSSPGETAADVAGPGQKAARLRAVLEEMGSVVVAFSGGVDSTFLCHIARDVLADRALAVTAASETFPSSECEEAKRLAKMLGIRHRVIRTSELGVPGFAANPPDRCYHCKRELFGRLRSVAAEAGLEWVADGTNADDPSDYRPGIRALQESGVRSPLLEAGLGKVDIRELSRQLKLPTWDKVACACLASRFPYGERITSARLRQIDRAERCLREFGFRTVRVRYHGNVGRIEVAPEDIARLVEQRQRAINALREAGFIYVALDLEGYRTGSLNEELVADGARVPTG